ncbi:MAG TPA: hypothetical protein VN417_05980 [Candidatus Cryosericum sp.]|nr:hypothetical protein [Candidatus Cryosericum sp.]
MQKKPLLIIIALLLLIVPAVSLAEAESVGSNDLIDRAKDYDGQTVVYEGEVVGDILYRGDYAWLAVFDGANTIGCYVTKTQAQQISFDGGYGKRGDTVRVEGVFHRACAEHGGDLDIHADTISVLAAGGLVDTPQSRLVTVLAAVLPLPAAALLLLVWKRRSTQKQSQKSLTISPEK